MSAAEIAKEAEQASTRFCVDCKYFRFHDASVPLTCAHHSLPRDVISGKSNTTCISHRMRACGASGKFFEPKRPVYIKDPLSDRGHCYCCPQACDRGTGCSRVAEEQRDIRNKSALRYIGLMLGLVLFLVWGVA